MMINFKELLHTLFSKPQSSLGYVPSGQTTISNKLTLEKIIGLIEENRGPENLDLSGKDLSGLDLSRDAVIRYRQRFFGNSHSDVCWQSRANGGLHLRGVKLNNANLSLCNLEYVDMKFANLERANFQASDLSRARLDSAILTNADMNRCLLNGASLSNAMMDNVDLAISDLTGADLSDASLINTSLYRTQLSGTKLSRRSIGYSIFQEDADNVRCFLLEHYSSLGEEGIQEWITYQQFEEAQQIYASLKSNFISIGNLEDASWAHIKQRQMIRKTHHPKYAKNYFKHELPEKYTLVSWRWWMFNVRHICKWWSDWFIELTCGYGELPGRTLFFAGFIIGVFAAIFMLVGGIKTTDSSTMTWLDYLNYSLGSFATVSFSQWIPFTPMAQTLTSIEALFGISVFALLMFALGNRISRS